MGPIPDEVFQQIKAALFQGNKIEAIKIFRAHTGLGLKETKEAIEKFEEDLRASSPDKFTAKKSGAGCAAALILLIILALIWIWL